MKSLYIEGNTFLHRLPAAAKIAGLAVFSLLVFMTRNMAMLAILATFACALHARCGMGGRESLYRLRPMLLMITVIALFHLLFTSPEEAGIAILRLGALLLAATTITATTGLDAFIDTVTTAMQPLERLGLIRAADAGLAFGLALRFLPEVTGRYEAIRDAHRARGMPVRATTLLVPLLISTLRDADAVADAIDARGIRGQNLAEHSAAVAMPARQKDKSE